MSGIAGIIRFDGGPVDADIIARMTSRMAHRGPDGIRHWVKGSVGLGHCLLRTTPESLEESQPLTNEDESLVLVMDGWLENWVELRQELLDKGARLRTRADGELVLRAYETWGEDCLAHIDGDFAFVIWDARQNRAFAARDRACLKQLHYHWDGNHFSFSTELRPVLDLPWVDTSINDGMMTEYLAGDVFTPGETLWSAIRRLPPAHTIRVKPHDLRIVRYWSLPAHTSLFYKRDDEYVAHYHDLLMDSVRRASRSAKPLACEASGGLDSSAIFALANSLLKLSKLPAPGLNGYLIAFDDSSTADERIYSRALGDHLSRPVAEIAPAFPPRHWYEDRARNFRDFPGFPNNGMMEACRTAIACAGHNVVLSGEGGDEWLSGYRLYYAEELQSGRLLNFLKCFYYDAAQTGTMTAIHWAARHGVFHLLPASAQNQIRKRFSSARSGARDAPTWLSSRSRTLLEERRSGTPAFEHTTFAREGQRPLVSKMDDVMSITLTALLEQLYAEHGLEIRAPFYSRGIMEFACAMPERLRLRGNETKWLHRQALAPYLPPSILHRNTKAEFSCSFGQQLDAMHDCFRTVVAPRLDAYIDQHGLEALLARYNRDGSTRWELWTAFACSCLLESNTARAS